VASLALERRLGPLDAAAIIVSNVIGGGILFTPPQIAALVPDAALFLSTWVAGGALAFAGAMAYAELAALRPRAGGEYVYLREAFGPLAAFLTGWTLVCRGLLGRDCHERRGAGGFISGASHRASPTRCHGSSCRSCRARSS